MESFLSHDMENGEVLWNHSYSWGPMFMDSQNVAGSLGCYFVGNWFIALQ